MYLCTKALFSHSRLIYKVCGKTILFADIMQDWKDMNCKGLIEQNFP